jgi:ornithine carbamoyltransferase
MAAISSVPVINLLSDAAHPCQVVADLLTLRQEFGSLRGRRLAWVGDANNVCRSLLAGAALTGMDVAVAAPEGYGLADEVVARAVARGIQVTTTTKPEEAVDGADAVVTDVWASMGQEAEAARRRADFAAFTVDASLMQRAAPHAVFLHCLPAHRGDEVAAEVIDGPQSRVWPEAENRMHAMRGLLWWLFA